MWVGRRLSQARAARKLGVARPLAAALPGAAVAAVTAALAVGGIVPRRGAAFVAVACLVFALTRALLAARERAVLRRKADALLRLGVRVHSQSALLSWRAAELAHAHNRLVLARSLAQIVRDLEHSPSRVSVVPLNRRAIAPHADLIKKLSDRLADLAKPVELRGVVLIEDLLTDGVTSPLYSGGSEQDLHAVITECFASLEAEPLLGRPPLALEHRRVA